MRNVLLTCLTIWLSLSSLFADDKVRTDINWPEFMRRQDMIWDTLPEYWYESAFMGNGELGLMMYKEPGENYLRLEIGNCNAHDHRPGGGLFNNPRLLTGHFALYPEGTITGGTLHLDLWNAETRAVIRTTRGELQLRAYVHATEPVIEIDITPGHEEQHFRWEWRPAASESPRYLYAQTPAGSWIKQQIPSDYAPNPLPDIQPGLSVQPLQAGGATAVAWKERPGKRGKRTYWASVTHTYPETDAGEQAVRHVNAAAQTGSRRLQETHRDWWHRFYPASFLSLPDGVKENFYWIQLYKLASATRSNGALIDCTGPWLTVTPWPNAWWNLNVQLTYWPLNTSNHLDLAASLENALYGHIQELRQNIPAAYRHNSLGIGRTSDFHCVSETVKRPGIDKDAEVGLLTWACHNLWLIYRHKIDDHLLREQLFPLLKQSVNYYLHFLQKEEENGYLHLPATYSPEYGSAEDCNFDLALLRWGCQTLLEICSRLSINDALIPRWREVLNQLTPYPTDPKDGLMIGRNTPYAFSHRHYSHLLAMYPLYLINCERPQDYRLIEQSLEAWQRLDGAHQGYSCTGASSLSSALGKGNDALKYLDKLFTSFLSVNTLYREAGPVIETPLSAVQSIHDMLLQSWGDKIRVFPAVPDSWKDIAYKDFRTEGAFLVTARRQEGRTAFISVKSLAGEPCTVVTDMPDPVFSGPRNFQVTRLQANTYRIDLKKGEEVLIRPKGSTATCVVAPVCHGTANHFGKKKPVPSRNPQ